LSNYFQIDVDSHKINKFEYTNEGYLRVPVKISRTGVFDYPEQGVKKLKSPQELFDADTLNSIIGLPITDEHPTINGRHVLVTPENHKQFTKGSVSDPHEIDGRFIGGTATIWDGQLIKKIAGGNQTEVSLGYTKSDVQRPGEFDGERYDVLQTEMRGNHLAITTSARGGSSIRLELDSNGQIKNNRRKDMSKKYLVEVDGKLSDADLKTTRLADGSDVQCDSEIHAEIQGGRVALKEVKVDLDSANVKIKELEAIEVDSKDEKHKALQLEIDTSKLQVEKLIKDLGTKDAEMDSKVEKGIEEAMEVRGNAKTLEIDSKGKSIVELKKDIIGKALDMDSSTIEDSEIDAHYKAALVVAKREIPKQKTPEIDSNDPFAQREIELAKLEEEK